MYAMRLKRDAQPLVRYGMWILILGIVCSSVRPPTSIKCYIKQKSWRRLVSTWHPIDTIYISLSSGLVLLLKYKKIKLKKKTFQKNRKKTGELSIGLTIVTRSKSSRSSKKLAFKWTSIWDVHDLIYLILCLLILLRIGRIDRL